MTTDTNIYNENAEPVQVESASVENHIQIPESVMTPADADGIDTPNVSNPTESTLATPKKSVSKSKKSKSKSKQKKTTNSAPLEPERPGNVNGNAQSETETVTVPTAMSTLENDEKRLLEQLENLKSKKSVALVADIVIELLNSSKNEKLKSGIAEIGEKLVPVSIMLDGTTGKWRYADVTATGKTISVSQPNSGYPTGQSKRSWISKLIAPDGTEYVAPMKTPVSNDLPGMEKLLGFVISKDGSGNSTSTVGKQNILKRNGWDFVTESNE